MNRQFIYTLLCLAVAFSFSCSRDKGTEVFGQDEYISVRLNVGNNIEEDSPRSVRFTVGDNDKPRFQFTNTSGEVSGTRKVYTTVTKGEGSARKVIFEADLDWEIQQGGRRLAYNGELKILHSEFKDATNLTLHAVTGERRFNKTNSEKQTELLSSFDENHTVNVEVPYVMTAPVKKVGEKTLTLAKAEEAKFKPKGVLTLFTIKNNLDVPIRPYFIKVYTPKYHRGIDVNQYGELTLSDSREDTPLLHEESFMNPIMSKSKTTLIAWLPKEDIANIKEVRYIGVGMQGSLTKTSSHGTDGSLLNYEIEFKPQKLSLDKGLAYTDNHGNVIPYMAIEGANQVVGPNFSSAEVQSRTTSEDAWLLKYYFPMFINRWVADGVISSDSHYWQEVIETRTPQHKEAENYWRDTPGVTSLSPTADWVILNRGGALHYEMSKFAYDQDSPGYNAKGSLYIARFINNQEYRVLQRLRSVDVELDERFETSFFHNILNMEVSFLPYDEKAVVDKTAFTKAYWDEREKRGEVQSIRFRAHFAVSPQGPYHKTYNHMLIPVSGVGVPIWFNTAKNFENGQDTDDASSDVTDRRLPIVTFTDKLPAH